MLAKRLEPIQSKEPKPALAKTPVHVEPPPAVPTVAEPPKAAEVPNPVASESKPTPVDEPLPPQKPDESRPTGSGKESTTIPPPEPPRDLGRGGSQHKAIQERIKAEAHALGFFAAVENQLAEKSNEAADVVLRKGDLAIAVEITVTTTIDHEFGNVKKCLAAGFSRVAVVSPKLERLKAVAEAVNAGLIAEERTRVSYHTPDEFIAELRKLAESATPPAPPTETERTTRGYTVRRHAPKVSPEERKAGEEAAIRLIAETMKRKA